MDDKDKKSSLGETLAFLAVAAILTAILYKLKTAVWNWATANRKRAWVCVPILLWPLVFMSFLIAVIIFLAVTGLMDSSNLNPPTDEQQFAQRLITLAVAILALVISLLITRRVVRKIDEETIHLSQKNPSFSDQVKSLLLKHQEKYQGRHLTDKELDKEFSSPPFYLDPKKWRKENFDGGRECADREIGVEDDDGPIIYKGPDLSEYGFNLAGEKIRPGEGIKHKYTFLMRMEDHMQSWNFAMARKLGLVDD